MPVTLSIKNAPDELVRRLKRRAAANHRSLQGELMAIVEAAAREESLQAPADVLARVRSLGLSTPAESAALIRAERDAR